MDKNRKNIVGLIPAAGSANRMGNLSFSKELFPLGMMKRNDTQIPKVVAMNLIESIQLAGVKEFYMIIRDGKWDIPAYFNNGSQFNMNMAYIIADKLYGVPYSLNQAFPFIGDKKVVMGFPDIIFNPANAYSELLNEMDSRSDTDVLLGLFPVDEPAKWDTVKVDQNNRLLGIRVKSKKADKGDLAWIMAVWNSKFTAFLNQYIESWIAENKSVKKNELQLSIVFIAARIAGLRIGALKFKNGYCVDIGTPQGLENYFLSLATK